MWVSRNSRSGCLLFISPDTWWGNAFRVIQLHALQSILKVSCRPPTSSHHSLHQFWLFDSRSSALSRHWHQIRCDRLASPQTVSQRRFQKVCNCFCRATTHRSSPWHNPLRSPSQLQKKAGHAVPTFMELSFNTSDHVSHAFRTCFCKFWPTYLLMSFRYKMCKSTRELHRRSALSTYPTWPSRMVRQRDFHHRVLSSLLTRAFPTLPSGMGENTSSGPSCSSVSDLLDLSTPILNNISHLLFCLPISTWEACNRCRSTLSHRQLRTLSFSSCTISFFRLAIIGDYQQKVWRPSCLNFDARLEDLSCNFQHSSSPFQLFFSKIHQFGDVHTNLFTQSATTLGLVDKHSGGYHFSQIELVQVPVRWSLHGNWIFPPLGPISGSLLMLPRLENKEEGFGWCCMLIDNVAETAIVSFNAQYTALCHCFLDFFVPRCFIPLFMTTIFLS